MVASTAVILRKALRNPHALNCDMGPVARDLVL